MHVVILIILIRCLPIVFHNLRGYDDHLIIKEADPLGNHNISAIPNTYGKSMGFQVGELKFIDSFQFMASGLENLIESLYRAGDDKYMSTQWKIQEHIDKLCRKGSYPNEWFDNNEKFNHDGLPTKEDVYSTLMQTHITDGESKHAYLKYEALGCNSFLHDHLAYLKSDVLLLADVFENVRNTWQSYYNVCPSIYISAPSLAWDAMLV